MRHGKSWAVLAALVLIGCGPSKPFRDMVGYVPPTSLPAQPKRVIVRDSPDQVWSNIVSYLEQSDFELDHANIEEKLIVAGYSGNPEPYVDCGSIVTHENGSLGQIAGSAQDVALNYRLDDQSVILKRGLNLDSRIIIRLEEQRLGTLVSTETTYIVTKTVDVEQTSGAVNEGSRETVSFGAGKRAEFSKGTACQPNGSLDVAVLQSLPNVVGTDESVGTDLSVASLDGLEPPADDQIDGDAQAEEDRERDEPTEVASDEAGGLDAAAVPNAPTAANPGAELRDWTLPGEGLPPAALPEIALETDAEANAETETVPNVEPETASPRPESQTAVVIDRSDDEALSIVDETTRTLLASLDCSGGEWHYCGLVEMTAPYRKVNVEQLLGLTINTFDSLTTQRIGSDVQLSIELPDFPAYLHVIYARLDGTIDNVISSPELWPPNLSHVIEGTGHKIQEPGGLAMIVAIASEQQLPPFAELDKSDTAAYLQALEQGLADIEASSGAARIAASQLLINVE
ncbi:MAG: hypothetical protein ACR2Q4_04665 [Geminicoccaceae bacterium]